MNVPETLGIESAIGFLSIAALAAIQSRTIRGAQRHRIEEICNRRGQPERCEQIIRGSETIAFIASSIVVTAAAIATLLAHQWFVTNSNDSLAAELSSAGGWIVLSWAMLVVAPMLFTKFMGAWFVVVTWNLWKPVVATTAPSVRFLSNIATSLSRKIGRRSLADDQDDRQDELLAVVDEAHREGWLPGTTRAMIEGVMDLDDVRVGQIMTPRTDMISIPMATPWDEAICMITESAHTRLPVWGQSPEDIIGILHTRELLSKLVESPGKSIEQENDLRPLLRPPYFVPESMSVQKLLRELQRGRTHLALVTDEFGGVSGLVTIEDALEEIVGEIADEHDEAFEDGIRFVSDTICEVFGSLRIDYLNERCKTQLPENADYETVGGFVFHEFGKIPHVGDKLSTHGVSLEVLAATRRRIDLIRIEKLPEAKQHGG